MILIPDNINSRKILYQDIKDDLQELASLNLENWVLFVIEDRKDNPILWSFAQLCIDKELLYMAAVGDACSQIDDLFDWAMLSRQQEGRNLPSWWLSDEDVLMTTWHHDFNEGFWYITSVACYEDWPIDTVLVANLTPINYLPVIKDLAKKIKTGWLPSD
jgi:hypothetical protein